MTDFVGVIGAGVIGATVAQAVATSGHQAILVDKKPSAIESARKSIRTSLRAAALLGKANMRAADVLAKIDFTTDIGAVAACPIVVENVDERWEVKSALYPVLDKICHTGTIIAGNTSTFPIVDLGRLTQRQDRVVGLHFMNPAHERPVVEVIRSIDSSDSTLAAAYDFLHAIGKEGITVKDSPGFVSNRVLMLTINEAIRIVEEGTAGHDDVDRLFRGCFGHPMGPLATADLIGLDTIALSLESLRDQLGDSKYEPAKLLLKMIANKCLGRKTGVGFYNYSSGESSCRTQ